MEPLEAIPASLRSQWLMARDNFPPSVVNLLRKRAANHCSNPDCRILTAGPGEALDSSINIGEAAHIKAASPGGPRYDANMTKAQRQSLENGVWLCRSCAAMVDRDVVAYPVELLDSWRRQADVWARSRIGKRPAQESDAVTMLTTALTGTGQPTAFAPVAIGNVHAGANRSLEHLDKRFSVTSSHDGRTTTFHLTPKEPVQLRFDVSPAAPMWKGQMAALREHGKVAELPMTAVTVEGSPLIASLVEQGARQGGTLRFSPPSVPLTLRLTAISAEGSKRFTSIGGSISGGFQSMTFTAKLFRGVATLSLRKAVESTAGNTFTMATDIERWEDVDVRDLPELDDLMEFVEALDTASHLDAKLLKGGRPVLEAEIRIDQGKPYGRNLYAFLRYTVAAREIANALDIAVPLAFEFESTAQDLAKVVEAADIASGRKVFAAADLRPSQRFLVNVEDPRLVVDLLESQHPVSLRHIASDGAVLRVFNRQVELPPVQIELEPVRLKLVSDEPIDWSQAVEMEWLPQENFRGVLQYVAAAHADA